MYQPKHLNRVNGRTKYRKSGVLIVSLILLLTLAVGGTVAYLMDATDLLVNTFKPTEADIEIEEEFDDNVKSVVTVVNKKDFPVFVRATFAIYWTDTKGVIVEPNTCKHSDVVVAEPWVEYPAGSGIYYYPYELPVGEETTNLLADPIRVEIMPEGVEYNLVVEVISEAIQAMPREAVKEAWGVTMPMSTGGGS